MRVGSGTSGAEDDCEDARLRGSGSKARRRSVGRGGPTTHGPTNEHGHDHPKVIAAAALRSNADQFSEEACTGAPSSVIRACASASSACFAA